MHKQLSNFAEIRNISTGEHVEGVDTANFDGVMFVLLSDDASITVQAQQADGLDGDGRLDGAENISEEYDDIASGELVIIDVYRPDKRYVGLNISNAAHVDGEVLALRYHSRNRPVNNAVDDEVRAIQLVSPDAVT